MGPRCTNSHLFYGICYLIEHSYIPSKFQYFSSSNLGGFAPADYCPVGYSDNTDTDSQISSFYSASCVFGSKQFSESRFGETIGTNSICVKSSLVSNNYKEQLEEYTTTYRAICHKMKCDITNKQTIFTIAGQTVTCSEGEGVLKNPTGFTGSFECPEFNMVCTSNNYCTDISSCIEKKSVLILSSDSNTGTKIPEDDIKKSNSNVLNKYYLRFFLLAILFIID